MDLNQAMSFTPFNYFERNSHMIIQLQSQGIYKVIIGLELETNDIVPKSKWFNRLDEAYGFLSVSISRYLLFHIENYSTPNEVWLKLESLHGEQNEMKRILLENDLISLSPRSLKTMEEFASKSKNLVLQL